MSNKSFFFSFFVLYLRIISVYLLVVLSIPYNKLRKKKLVFFFFFVIRTVAVFFFRFVSVCVYVHKNQIVYFVHAFLSYKQYIILILTIVKAYKQEFQIMMTLFVFFFLWMLSIFDVSFFSFV